MDEFKLHKKLDGVSWKAFAVENAYAHFELQHKQTTVHDARLIVTEAYCPAEGRAVVKEAWITLTPEDLDALANAALVMADDIRVARARKEHADGVQPQHAIEFPHGIGCPGCIALQVCNECGRMRGTGGCTNGRCSACCKTICDHATEGGASHG